MSVVIFYINKLFQYKQLTKVANSMGFGQTWTRGITVEFDFFTFEMATLMSA